MADRTVVNTQAEQADAQNSYLNDLLLAIVALLAAVALVNTLVVATLEQGDSLLLLRRIGTTTRQLFGMVVLRTVTLCAAGTRTGAATAATAVLAVTRALTGTWHPHLAWSPIAAGAAGVVGLAVLAVLAPTAWVLRRR